MKKTELTPAQDRALQYVGSLEVSNGFPWATPPRRDVLARLEAQGLITIKVTYNPHARKIDRVQWFSRLTKAGREYLEGPEAESPEVSG